MLCVPTVRPSAPVNFTATVLSSTGIRLSWGQPTDDGGTPLTNYVITYHSNAEDHVIINTNGVQLTRQLDNLAPFTAYQLQVSAANLVGIGPASVTVNAMTLVGGKSAHNHIHIWGVEVAVGVIILPPNIIECSV